MLLAKLLPAACCLLPAACCLLPAACCLLPAACCQLMLTRSPEADNPLVRVLSCVPTPEKPASPES